MILIAHDLTIDHRPRKIAKQWPSCVTLASRTVASCDVRLEFSGRHSPHARDAMLPSALITLDMTRQEMYMYM